MIVRISRYILILLAVLVMGSFLPDFYWLFFDVKSDIPAIEYTHIDSSFIFIRHNDNSTQYRDGEGNALTREEYEAALPLYYYMQLISDGKMPDSLNGAALDLNEIKRNRNMHRVRPYQLDMPAIMFYPLLESKSGRVRLEMPNDYFRIKDRMEFVDCTTQTVEEEKSQTFSSALDAAGFSYPAKKIFGNPTTRKAFDEGYFVIDNKDQLFHIKMVQGEPFVKNTNFPKDVPINTIIVSENGLREYYGLLISDDNKIYFLTYDNYALTELPTGGYYNRKDCQLVVTTNLLYRTVMIRNNRQLDYYVTDRNYQILDEYHESWKTRDDYFVGTLAKIIFPFSVAQEDDSSLYVNFYWNFNYPLAFIGNLIALLLFYVHLKRKERTIMSAIPEIVLIAFTGFYGLIAVLVYIYVPLWRNEPK